MQMPPDETTTEEKSSRSYRKLMWLAAASLAILAACAVPFFTRARSISATNACIGNLGGIDSGKWLWVKEHPDKTNDVPTLDELRAVLGKDERLVCPSGGTYIVGRVGETPKCTFPGHKLP
jgi:hypothetical protein